METTVALKCIATSLSGLYAGSALYINLADHPARATLNTENYRKHFIEAFNRARVFMAPLALGGALSAFGASYLDKSSDLRYVWAAGAGTLMLVFPWTKAVILSDVHKLLKNDVIETEGEKWVRDRIGKWNSSHKFRTAVSIISFGLFVYALSQ